MHTGHRGVRARGKLTEQGVGPAELQQLEAGLALEHGLGEPPGGEVAQAAVFLPGGKRDQGDPVVGVEVQPRRNLRVFRGARRKRQHAAESERSCAVPEHLVRTW